MDAVVLHLAWLGQRGKAATTIYDRARFLHRLQDWLACYGGTPTVGKTAGSCAEPRPANRDCESRPDGPGLLSATAADLAAWRASLTHSPGVICGYVSHATQFYDWAVREGLATVNPAAGLPVPRRPRRLPRPVDTGELMHALDTAPRRIRPWLVLGAWAGLRAKEVALLRAENLTLSGPQPMILVASDATKGIHERTVPLSGFAAGELRAYGVPGRGWVFPRHDGQPGPNRPHAVSHLVAEHFRACGSQATFHQLRHWFLTAAYAESGDLRLVQELAGHRDPASTAGYTALVAGRAAAVVNAIPVPQRLRVVS